MGKKKRCKEEGKPLVADPIHNRRAYELTAGWAQDVAGAITRGDREPEGLKRAIEGISEAHQAAFDGILKAALRAGESRYRYDVFISHSHEDLALVETLDRAFREKGLHAYYDEKDPALDRKKVSRETAARIQEAMRDCRALLLVISENSAGSGWVPWEVGFFDAMSGLVFTLPVDQAARDAIRKQEWHQLYTELDQKTAVDDFCVSYSEAVAAARAL